MGYGLLVPDVANICEQHNIFSPGMTVENGGSMSGDERDWKEIPGSANTAETKLGKQKLWIITKLDMRYPAFYSWMGPTIDHGSLHFSYQIKNGFASCRYGHPLGIPSRESALKTSALSAVEGGVFPRIPFKRQTSTTLLPHLNASFTPHRGKKWSPWIYVRNLIQEIRRECATRKGGLLMGSHAMRNINFLIIRFRRGSVIHLQGLTFMWSVLRK